MRRWREGRVAVVVMIAGLTAVIAACGGSAASAPVGSALAVVAAENVWGDIAGQIGGTHVSVTSIITDPNADPHSYETDPRGAAAVGAAGLVIDNGAGYDSFLDKLLNANPVSSRDVLTVATAVGVGGDNPNPHLWYSPTYVVAAARAIETRLASHDAADAPVFAANLQAFLTSYQPYIDTLAIIRAKYSGTRIAYTERVAGYLVQAAGLVVATPATFAQAIEDGNDPSPGDVAAMEAAVSGRQVRVLLYNAQVTSPVTQKVRDLATAAGIPVVGVAETIPAGNSRFQAWQIDQARAILTALGG